MTEDEAVKFCEETECEDCPVYQNDLDKRTEAEWYEVPCCMNLVTER